METTPTRHLLAMPTNAQTTPVYNAQLILMSADMKQERIIRSLEEARQALAQQYDNAPWAISLAYGDNGKLMGDILRRRVGFQTVLAALDGARRSGLFPASQMHNTEAALMAYQNS